MNPSTNSPHPDPRPASDPRAVPDPWSTLASDWMQWGPEAFARARELGRPVLLSIGYPSSTWCKKMVDDVFTAPEVIEAIDAGFVPVAVDRDTRPDVDAVYMAALVSVAGRGGWPLTAMIDHDGRPFWIGTYVTAEALAELLNTLAQTWRSQPDKIAAAAQQVADRVRASSTITPATSLPTLDLVNLGLTQMAAAFDSEWGGFGREPKFASPPHLHLMHRAALATQADGPTNVVKTTLGAMSAGGIFDQIGGGFHRYTTDREWLIPQFEKTLADQAQLVTLYQDAFAMWGDPVHQRVVAETIGYALQTLTLDNGGFASGEASDSRSADGVDVAGAFYTWTPDEIRTVLSSARVGDEAVDVDAVLQWFDITPTGHLDGRSIPNRRHHRDDQIRSPEMSAVRGGLSEIRSRRPRPALDRTVITEYHALMVRSLAGATAFFRQPAWHEAAVRGGEFMLDHLRGPTGWHRGWRETGVGDALASDYCAGLAACLRLGEITGERRWIEAATEAADLLLDNFFDPIDGGIWSTSEFGEELFVRLKQIEDHSVPSPNALAAEGLLRLAAVTGEMRYKHHAERILQLLGGVDQQRAVTIPYGLSVIELHQRGLVQIVIATPEGEPRPDWLGTADDEAARMVRLIGTMWRPNFVLWWGDEIDSPLLDGRGATDRAVAYVCRDFETQREASTAEELYSALTGKPLEPDQRLNA